MGPETEPLVRLAIFQAWNERCVWCGKPIFYNSMEIDHLIPKSVESTTLPELINAHGLPKDFDVLSLANLAPSCGVCNGPGRKGAKVPPLTPMMSLLLMTAGEKVPEIERSVAKLKQRKQLEPALLVVQQAAESGSEDARAALMAAAETVATQVEGAVGQKLERLHPALGLVYGAWMTNNDPSIAVAWVTDGERGGYTGTDISFMCGHCGSYGPWNGVICLTCGQRSEPD